MVDPRCLQHASVITKISPLDTWRQMIGKIHGFKNCHEFGAHFWSNPYDIPLRSSKVSKQWKIPSKENHVYINQQLSIATFDYRRLTKLGMLMWDSNHTWKSREFHQLVTHPGYPKIHEFSIKIAKNIPTKNIPSCEPHEIYPFLGVQFTEYWIVVTMVWSSVDQTMPSISPDNTSNCWKPQSPNYHRESSGEISDWKDHGSTLW